MRPIIAIIILCVGSSLATAQTPVVNQDTIVWEIDTLQDVAHAQAMGYVCQFITHGTNDIHWVQNGFVTVFSINSTTGSWPAISGEGNVEFQVTYQNRQGTLWLGRNGTDIELRMDFTENGQNTMPFIFRVNSYSKTN